MPSMTAHEQAIICFKKETGNGSRTKRVLVRQKQATPQPSGKRFSITFSKGHPPALLSFEGSAPFLVHPLFQNDELKDSLRCTILEKARKQDMERRTKPKILTRDFTLGFFSRLTFQSAHHILLPTLPIYLSRLGSEEARDRNSHRGVRGLFPRLQALYRKSPHETL